MSTCASPTQGKMQHVTMDAELRSTRTFAEGYAFDGSSIAGWKGINESDMTLMPDPASAHMDPFFAQTTMAIFCDVLEPSTGTSPMSATRARSPSAPKPT